MEPLSAYWKSTDNQRLKADMSSSTKHPRKQPASDYAEILGF